MSSKFVNLQTADPWDKIDLHMSFVLSLNMNIFRQLSGLYRSYHLSLFPTWPTLLFFNLLASEDISGKKYILEPVQERAKHMSLKTLSN